ncbi:hypothetical protein [Streptomyces subrutilus]|uniref:Uncharacterized protein n=1 Tax=Streptomyces subrutilus TaxID=36818 RepID=A0A1E5PMR4_9ACTN|nr:hypothetical protein [Streptomyces subrutilus]OEJ30866.1 hypothetical protein BGK67_05445 [Streptomyces subrutilus]
MAQAPERTPAHPERLERGHPFRQWKTWRIPGTELTLAGYSRANDKTFFHIPELRCALDAGLAEGRQPETVFGDARPANVMPWAHPDSRLPEQHQHGGGRHVG